MFISFRQFCYLTLLCTSCGAIQVRLQGGLTNKSGRVEVFYNSQWGTVCDDSWDDTDASVICRMLGFESGKAFGTAKFGRGTGPIWLDDVSCRAVSDISHCSHKGWNVHNCNHGEDAGVWCANENGIVLNAYSPNAGTILLFHDRQWGTVCDDYFTDVDANVACRELGFSSGGVAYSSATFGAGSGKTWMDNVACTGLENSLAKCKHNGWNKEDCSHSEDAGVYCYKGSWSTWSACTVTCKGGTKTRHIRCSGVDSNSRCKPRQESIRCNTQECPVHGQWGGWQEWTSCSVTCSQGSRSRTRACNNPTPAHGGQACRGDSSQVKSCDAGVECPIDGQWNSWVSWSSCSVTCSNGTRTRSRECNNPAPAHGGRNCAGNEKESDDCDTELHCPVDGLWNSWVSWSTCSVTCSIGTRTRSRECNNPAPAHGGRNCTGNGEESDDCDTELHCPVDGSWSIWESWSSCSVTCANGTRSRSRNCGDPAPAYGGENCTGNPKELQTCDTEVYCPVDGQWNNWSEWSLCSVTCANGTMYRSRDCSNPTPAHGGEDCEGDGIQTVMCDTGMYCPVDGSWSFWESWSPCSVTCANGTRSRSRNCGDPAPAYGGENCIGDAKELQMCDTEVYCPVDGSWSVWDSWSPCSVTCAYGIRSRSRNCDNPAPAYGGENCIGDTEELQMCDTEVYCPVDGSWSIWESWSSCSVTCANGIRSRSRNCDDPAPAYGGENCIGDTEELQMCDTEVYCPVGGSWSAWDSWSPCSVTCANGTRSRSRKCDNPAPAYGGENCIGNTEKLQMCDTEIYCPVDGQWNNWSEWSLCSVTCANGTMYRSRDCSNPTPAHGGERCEGDGIQTVMCDTGMYCPVDGQWGGWSNWSECSVTCECGYQHRLRECDSPSAKYGGVYCNGSNNDTKICSTDIMCPDACGDGMQMCFDNRSCIDVIMLCDGIEQCPGGDDELNCIESFLYSTPVSLFFSGSSLPRVCQTLVMLLAVGLFLG